MMVDEMPIFYDPFDGMSLLVDQVLSFHGPQAVLVRLE